MGEWHKYQAPDPNYPCTNCEMGWGSQSHKVVNGIDFFKTDSCDETCHRLKDYFLSLNKKLEPMFARGV